VLLIPPIYISFNRKPKTNYECFNQICPYLSLANITLLFRCYNAFCSPNLPDLTSIPASYSSQYCPSASKTVQLVTVSALPSSAGGTTTAAGGTTATAGGTTATAGATIPASTTSKAAANGLVAPVGGIIAVIVGLLGFV